MNFKGIYALLFLMIFHQLGLFTLQAQIQFPGKPMGDYRLMKAADVIYMLPPVDPLEIEAAKQFNRAAEKKPVQFAIERPLDLDPDNHGKWVEQDQFRIWRIHIISPGALSMGLIFNEFKLKGGVKIFIYDPDLRNIRGAYTPANNKKSKVFAVGHISGDELIVEMQVPKRQNDFGNLRLESLSHAFLDVGQRHPADDCPPGKFGCSEDCEIDINCEEGSAWQLSKKSVVRIYTSRQYCTGVLLNNTSYDGTPYILTSEHCVNQEYYANRSVFDFNYESPGCFGGDGSLDMSVSNSDSIAVGDSIDFSLLKLSALPPDYYDVYYAGWELFNEQPSYSVCIHHPYGDVKKISYDFQAPSVPEDLDDIPNSDLRDYFYFSYWWIKEWDIGSTEGGSSGSPLFNARQRVMGILSGGRAECGAETGYDSATNRIIFSKVPNRNDFFTKLNVAWDYNGEGGPSLQHWLDPSNTGNLFCGGLYPTNSDPPSLSGYHRFTVYPNPASQVMSISSNTGAIGIESLTIFDISGTLKLKITGNGMGSLNFDTGSLTPGIYLLVIEGNGAVEYHKIIVAR